MIPLSIEDSDIWITFVQRTNHVNHPGQISFPGGHVEKSDSDYCYAALREAREEIGIPPENISVIGCLSDQITPSGFWIRPFVGLMDRGTPSISDPGEIAEILQLRLQDLHIHHLNPTMYRWKSTVIWGVTARMVDELLSILPAGKQIRD